jgi:hypothetical protein
VREKVRLTGKSSSPKPFVRGMDGNMGDSIRFLDMNEHFKVGIWSNNSSLNVFLKDGF